MTIDLSSISHVAGPMLDAMPHPVFVVDEDVAIFAVNEASRKIIGTTPELIIKRRAGEILHCIHSKETEDGCGRSEFCDDCIIRESVNKAFREHITSRKKARMEIITGNRIEAVYLAFVVTPFEYMETNYVLMLFENITELIELREILPICSSCHKIRDDIEYWHRVESYFYKHLDLNFSHGICPDCAKKLYND